MNGLCPLVSLLEGGVPSLCSWAQVVASSTQYYNGNLPSPKLAGLCWVRERQGSWTLESSQT